MADNFSTAKTLFDPLDNLKIKDERLRRALQGRERLICDGAMGTMLQAKGVLAPGVNPDVLCITQPEEITAVHASYVQAGSQIVATNTFGANRLKLNGEASVDEVFKAAVSCVKAANALYIAGSIGPLGTLLEPLGTMTFDEAYDLFAEQVLAAEAAGCDIILFETLASLKEAKAAVLAAKENCRLPVFVTMTFEEDGRTFLGTPPAVAASTLGAMGVQVLGANCSVGPDQMLSVAKELVEFSRVPVMIQPNAGLPRVVDGKTVYDVTPQQFAQAIEPILKAGATIVGGCCGTSPEFIAREAEAVASAGTIMPRSPKNSLVLSSATKALVLEEGSPAIAPIGERINPTGKPKLKEALRKGDFDYLVGEAVQQLEAGAVALDVNCGMPELDEPAILSAAVNKLQATVTCPLVIDSSDSAALDQAARHYEGRPLINSVTGKTESLEAVLPIAAKYGACVIGLTMDENGIPPTAQGRLAIARRIVEAAAKYGMPACDIVVDCLTMACATNQAESREILDAIRLCKDELGVRTTLGVSNISFGLPQRPVMNATFLAAALGAGLDLPIVNPMDGRTADVLSCYRVLNMQDIGASEYISRCAALESAYEMQQKPTSQQVVASSKVKHPSQADEAQIPDSLGAATEQARQAWDFILAGRKEPMAEVTQLILESCDPLVVINDLFIPALDEVGKRFDDGRFFLPQLMASAEAVKTGFDVVKASMPSTEAAQKRDERPIIIATVKGDIHDIGKNIVRMLLENYGYSVIDLGRDVEPQAVVDAAREHEAILVGLSALMTTTVKAMEETIKLLHEQLPDVKIMVGGAVLTPEYSQQIVADFYAKDAAASARIAAQVKN